MIEYAIEADPGRLTASFPTFATEGEARRAVEFLAAPRHEGDDLAERMAEKLGEPWPRVLCRNGREPWEVLPAGVA